MQERLRVVSRYSVSGARSRRTVPGWLEVCDRNGLPIASESWTSYRTTVAACDGQLRAMDVLVELHATVHVTERNVHAAMATAKTFIATQAPKTLQVPGTR